MAISSPPLRRCGRIFTDFTGCNLFSKNLGLGEAAKRDVGTGANQIPDMNSFASSLGFNGYQKLPSGLIIQWGAFNVKSTSDAVGITDITFPISFPNGFRNVNAIMPTLDPSKRFTSFATADTNTTKVRFTYVTPTSNAIYWTALGY